MHHVFICYPRSYLGQVTPLHDTLELALRNIYQRDAQVFQDTSDLQAGNKWENDINTALEEARVMIVVVVPTILESPQCRREMLHFIETPGKHIIPLICEEVPRLSQLAAGIDDHPEGSAEHDIAVCAHALQTWQAYDFSQVVYLNQTETAYKVAVAELARMIRNKLDFEDHAAEQPAEPERKAAQENADTGAEEAGRRKEPAPPDQPTDPPRKSRRGLLIATPLVVVAAAVLGLWLWGAPSPTEEREERARTVLVRALDDAAEQADHLDFDASTGALTVTAPVLGRVSPDISLQPAIDPMLEAGFVPVFANDREGGEACFTLGGAPLTLTGNVLSDGEQVTLRFDVAERPEARPQRICVTAESTWVEVGFDRAEMTADGAILAAPSDDARELRRVFAGQVAPGPFWVHDDLPGWVRMEYRGARAFIRREMLRPAD